MNYLNLNISTLRAPEFLGSEPVARATWLCVVGYCIDQENNGRVLACKGWKDRQWQQTCGVTLEEVNASAPLLAWDGDDLVVWRYPLAHQAKCETNRENGRAGGLSKSQAKAEAARVNGAKHKPSEDPSDNPSETEASTQHKIKKGKDKVRVKEGSADGSALSDEQWLASLAKDPAFAGLDVSREFARMSAWCSVNRKQPSRRRFINWLNRAERPMAAPGAVTQDTFGSVRPGLEAW